MQLSEYLTQNELSDEEFGKRVKRDRTSILRLRTGKQKPSADVLQAITDATDGAVTPNDFFDIPDEAAA